MKTVKLKKDLPGCPAGTELELAPDGWLYYHLDFGYRAEFGPDAIKAHPDFFEIIEEPKYKEGDWVTLGDKFVGDPRTFKIANPRLLDRVRNAVPGAYYPATPAEIKSVTEKEDEIEGLKCNINHGGVITQDPPHYFFSISELKRIISIAENLQEK